MITKNESKDEEEIMEETYLEEEIPDSEDDPKDKSLHVSEYFEIADEDQPTTRRLGSDELSYSTTSSNSEKRSKGRFRVEIKESDDENEEIEDRSFRKSGRMSKAWEYFTKKDPEKRIATCKVCYNDCSYMSSVSNLLKHVRRRHGMAIFVDDEQEDDVEKLPERGEPKDKRKSLRSGVWEYFEVADEEQRTATCRLCSDAFSYRTTSTNLAKHLKRRHCVEIKNSDDENEDIEDRSYRKSGKMSRAWEYFTKKDPEKRIATCKVCDNDCSYMSSVSNLMKHVRRKHGMGFYADEEQDEDTEKVLEYNNRSNVWLYFKRIDKANGVAVCLICKKRLSHLTSITNLKRHLSRKHPQVQLDAACDSKKMLISSDGQLYEIEDDPKQEVLDHDDDDNGDDADQNAEPMEIYLDEIDGNVIEKANQKPVKKFKRLVVSDSEDTSDDEVTLKKRYVRKQSDSLDRFGKYLVSLLRQLPKGVSNQLQADFVKQIMSCENNVKNNGYVTNITDCAQITDETVTVTGASNDNGFVQTTIVDS